jgi:hypothetical protein
LSGNPFNGIVFLALSAGLAMAAFRVPDVPLRLDSRAWTVRGAAVVGFGTIYPDFLRTESWIAYLFASPFGVIPCPTLSVAIGMTLAITNLRSGIWVVPLLLAGVLYAAIGVFVLGVTLDWGLFIAAALLGTALAETRLSRPEGARPGVASERDTVGRPSRDAASATARHRNAPSRPRRGAESSRARTSI